MKRRFRVDASKKIQGGKSSPDLHKYFDGLDDRYNFDLDDEFEIYLDTLAKSVPCYVVDSGVFDDGAGLSYTVVVAVPSEDAHWQIEDDVYRNLEKYIHDQVSGSDYDGWVEYADMWDAVDYHLTEVPDAVLDTCKPYVFSICVVPYNNIGAYGDYGIDAGVE